MSDAAAPTAETPAQEPTPRASPTTDPKPPADTDWQAEARKWEKRAKDHLNQVNELKPLADQAKALEEASKSEIQRATEAAEKAQRDAENAQADAIRYKAAATYGIGADHFDLLGSGTEDEITARAEKIAALAAAQTAATQTAPPPATRPVEQLRPGATPAGAESEDDVILAKLFGPPK